MGFAAKLDRTAFGLLLALGATFALEVRQPLIRFGVMVLTDVETLIALMLLAWLGARLAARRLPRIPKMLALAITAKQTWLRWLLGAAMALSLLTLVLTLSRAGVVALGAGLIVVISYAWWKGYRPLVYGAMGVGALLALLVIAVLIWNPM